MSRFNFNTKSCDDAGFADRKGTKYTKGTKCKRNPFVFFVFFAV